MAMADYRLCDVCGGKAFYDSNLDYEFIGQSKAWSSDGPIEKEDCVRDCGYKLQYLGDWVVLCKSCAQTHKCVIVPIEDKNETPT